MKVKEGRDRQTDRKEGRKEDGMKWQREGKKVKEGRDRKEGRKVKEGRDRKEGRKEGRQERAEGLEG
jgi:hypothetical protein